MVRMCRPADPASEADTLWRGLPGSYGPAAHLGQDGLHLRLLARSSEICGERELDHYFPASSRQTLIFPTLPIVVLIDAITHAWRHDDCLPIGSDCIARYVRTSHKMRSFFRSGLRTADLRTRPGVDRPSRARLGAGRTPPYHGPDGDFRNEDGICWLNLHQAIAALALLRH